MRRPPEKAISRYLVEVEGLQQRRYKVTIEGSFRYYANQNGEAEEAATLRALELLIELREELEHELDQWVRLWGASGPAHPAYGDCAVDD